MVFQTDSKDSEEDDLPPISMLRIECFGLESAAPTVTRGVGSCSGSGGWSLVDCLRHCNPVKLLRLDAAMENILEQWQVLAFGQAISFLNVANGAAQASLSLSCHLYAPLFTLGIVYVVLALGLIPLWWERRHQWKKPSELQDDLLEGDEAQEGADAGLKRSSSFMTTSSHGTAHSVLEPAFKPDPTRTYSLLGIIPLSAPALAYLPMATLDVYAQYFYITSIRYTTLTSVTLLDSIAIPTAMLLSSIILARQYRMAHFLGILLCFCGIFMDIFQDYTTDDATGTGGADLKDYPYKIRGDMLAIMGACMFGCQEVLGEVAVRNLGGSNEYLAMLGFWGLLISLGQSFLSEQEHVLKFFKETDQLYCGKSQAWILLFAYIVSTFCYYHGVARFLAISDAAFFNLSLLTGAAWSVLFGVLFLDRAPKPLFYVAVTFIVAGVITYEMASTPVVEDEEGRAMENTKFRRWRKRALRFQRRIGKRCRRKEGEESDDSQGDSSDNKSDENQFNDHHDEYISESRVIV